MPFDDDLADCGPRPMTAAERILAALSGLGVDEGEVLALVAERLRDGRSVYGELRPATDPRDFRREALEEVADGLVYAAAALMRAKSGSVVAGPGATGNGWNVGEAPIARRPVDCSERPE